MNRISLLALIGVTALTACSNPNTGDADLDISDAITDTTETLTYQLPNGKNINVAYIFSGSEASALLTLDGKTHELKTKESSDSSAIYEKDNIILITKKTKVFLSYENQPETEMELINPIFQSYQSSDEDILAVYHSIPKDKPYVVLQRENGNEYLLPQKEAWAKRAVYSNDSLTWEVNKNSASLEEKGKTIAFKELNLENPDKPLHK